jgi:hypothetical protein
MLAKDIDTKPSTSAAWNVFCVTYGDYPAERSQVSLPIRFTHDARETAEICVLREFVQDLVFHGTAK